MDQDEVVVPLIRPVRLEMSSHFVVLYYDHEGVEIVGVYETLHRAMESRDGRTVTPSIEEWRGNRRRRWWGEHENSEWEAAE